MITTYVFIIVIPLWLLFTTSVYLWVTLCDFRVS